eukprot:GHRQ01013515.1.p1 GENE.GHRQ01013515.1~~GHRQ01013515.1.p1  ORF type:complete len:141 (+),score=70.65 GHRQ01013515.1:77-499(+)
MLLLPLLVSVECQLEAQLTVLGCGCLDARTGDGLQMAADGRRLSTRQRNKPMEFWRNERVEYARDHQSLPTVKTRVAVTPDPVWPAPDAQHDRKRKQHKLQQLEQQRQEQEQEQAAAAAGSAAPKRGRGRPPGSKKKGKQ